MAYTINEQNLERQLLLAQIWNRIPERHYSLLPFNAEAVY
jgi:hypothetical protein